MKIYLVRHGETAFNEGPERIRGRVEVPLSEAGLRHADEVGEKLSKVAKMDKIYYSSVNRAKQTAEGVFKYQPGALFLEDKHLIDISWGDWEGKAYDEVFSKKEYETFWTNPATMTIPNGESFYSVLERMDSLIKRVRAEEDPSANLVFVSHGAVLNLLMCYLLGCDLSMFWSFYMQACGYSCVEFDKRGNLRLVVHNATEHLS